jgi:hypothetical protein
MEGLVRITPRRYGHAGVSDSKGKVRHDVQESGRAALATAGDKRTALAGQLDCHRATILKKFDGLDDEQAYDFQRL